MEDLIKRLVEREEKNSGSIAVLEVHNTTTRKDLDRALRELEVIRNSVQHIEVMQATKSSIPLCTAPNMCIELKANLEKLAATVQTLVDYKSETKGGLRVMLAITAFVGSIGGAAISYGLRHFTNIGVIPHP